jgi:uncharacterized protein
MNAAHSIDHAGAETAAQHRAAEPSMEEILASIRRIIADDDALPLAPRPAPRLVIEPAPAVMPPVAPALALINPVPRSQAAPEPAPPADDEPPFADPEFASDLAAAAQPAAQAEPANAGYFHHESATIFASDQGAPLVSSDTGVKVHASFESLAATIMAQNSAMVEESIRSMLRPMLKSWLDDNLPVIVEKLVRSEIERVARGGR